MKRSPGRPKKADWSKVKFDKLSVRVKTKKLVLKHAKEEKIPIYEWVHRTILLGIIYREQNKNTNKVLRLPKNK